MITAMPSITLPRCGLRQHQKVSSIRYLNQFSLRSIMHITWSSRIDHVCYTLHPQNHFWHQYLTFYWCVTSKQRASSTIGQVTNLMLFTHTQIKFRRALRKNHWKQNTAACLACFKKSSAIGQDVLLPPAYYVYYLVIGFSFPDNDNENKVMYCHDGISEDRCRCVLTFDVPNKSRDASRCVMIPTSVENVGMSGAVLIKCSFHSPYAYPARNA